MTIDPRTRLRRWLRARQGVRWMRGTWGAIERAMHVLLEDAPPHDREQTARALGFLARHAFNFGWRYADALSPADRLRVAVLHPDIAGWVLAPALLPGEGRTVVRRMRAAVSREAVW